MEILKLFFEKIENKTYTVFALIVGLLILVAAFVASDSFISKYITSNYLKWAYLLVLIVWITYWLFNRFWIPTNNRKNTGLVICIYADTHEAEQALKLDFISSVKKQIVNSQIGEVFNIIVIKNHLAAKYNNFKTINDLHKKVKGHIYIFGETKKRKNGDEQYFLSLDGLVLHAPVSQQLSNEISRDFVATLPKGINFKDEFAFLGFQISANIVVKSVEYIIGLVSFISGNSFLAIKLHTDLKNQILLIPQNQRLPGDNVILGKIDNLLANEYAVTSQYYFVKNEKTKAVENLNLSLKLNANCYRALITESIIAFSWENDAKKSLAITKKCHSFDFPEWRYNEAFLYFWLGDYSAGLKQCIKIKNQNYSNDSVVSQEIITFNENILASNDSMPILYFWLGYNYYYKQNNLPMALKNFELFEQKSTSKMVELKQKTSAWLIDIKQQMKIK